MQKIVGLLLMLSGCMGLGLWYSMQYKQQLENLQKMCRILELMCGEIRYGRSTLPECCRQLTKRVEAPYQNCFQQIYEACMENEGESFARLSKEYLEQELKDLVVDKADKDRFIACFSESGFAEGLMQLHTIEQTRKELEDKLLQLRKESASKCKLALSLGTMSGLLLVILFL